MTPIYDQNNNKIIDLLLRFSSIMYTNLTDGMDGILFALSLLYFPDIFFLLRLPAGTVSASVSVFCLEENDIICT